MLKRSSLLCPRRRAVLRAVGQLSVIMCVAATLTQLGILVGTCMAHTEDSWCDAGFGLGQLFQLRVDELVSLALCAGLLWATARQTRARLAVCLAPLLALQPLAWPVYFLLTGGYNPNTVAQMLGFLAVVWIPSGGSVVLLLVSYLGPPLRLDEPVLGLRSRWIWWIGVPLLPLCWLGNQAEAALAVLNAPVLPLLLLAAALYGAMRRRRPLPGAAPWRPVALLLGVLGLPVYVWTTFDTRFHPDLPGVVGSTRSYATTLGVMLALVVALALWERARPSTPRRADRPATTSAVTVPFPRPDTNGGSATTPEPSTDATSTPPGPAGGAAQPATNSADKTAAATGGD